MPLTIMDRRVTLSSRTIVPFGHALELSPAYVDVAIERWQAFTGEKAVLDATGEPFAVLAEQRAEPDDGV